jgi:carboxymethylenebutenolidase
MKEIRKEDLNQEVFDLYDDYAHNKINRRKFMDKLSAYAVGGITVASLASFLMPKYAEAQQIKPDDPRLKSEYIEYSAPEGAGTMKGLLSLPTNASGKLPGIVVVHENRGLNPYIEDTARIAALEGFITLAPDALAPLGGTPAAMMKEEPCSESGIEMKCFRISWPLLIPSWPMKSAQAKSESWASALVAGFPT